jgi:hypothetical protein
VEELARFDAAVAAARAAGEPPRVLLCSADAHGYPSYRAAFEAFSMHLPIRLGGDAPADSRAVLAALLDGRAFCVYDGVAPAGHVRLEAAAGGALELSVETPRRAGRAFRLLRDGREVEARVLSADGPARVPFCVSGCGPGTYRVEGTLDGRPWIFTNPVTFE